MVDRGRSPGYMQASRFRGLKGTPTVEETPMTKPIPYEEALRDPAAVFAAPDDVLAASDLSTEQKVAILRQWEYDESEIAVAQEEGMPGGDTKRLQAIAAALVQLEARGETTASSKQKSSPKP